MSAFSILPETLSMSTLYYLYTKCSVINCETPEANLDFSSPRNALLINPFAILLQANIELSQGLFWLIKS